MVEGSWVGSGENRGEGDGGQGEFLSPHLRVTDSPARSFRHFPNTCPILVLLVPQRNNRIDLGSPGSRIEAENDTDSGTDEQGQENAGHGDDRGHA